MNPVRLTLAAMVAMLWMTSTTVAQEALRVTSNGNVGIGTSTPTGLLSLGQARGNSKLVIWEDGTLRMGFGVQNSEFRFHLPAPQNRFSFFDAEDGNELVRIQGTGNVGIGTSSPSQKLSVAGMIQSTTGGFVFPDGTVQATAATGSGSSADNDWTVSGNDMFAGVSGNVGIGTSAPSAPLHVIARGGNSPPSNGLYVYNPTNGPDEAAVASLRVAGASAGDPYISLDIAGEAGWTIGMDNDDDNKLKFARNWSHLDINTALTIDRSGNVGIGTTTPRVGYLLDVNGGIATNNFGQAYQLFTEKQNGTRLFAVGSDAIFLESTVYIGNNAAGTELVNINGAGQGIELGAGVTKEFNAGKIAYQRFSEGLDIVGAGTSGNRKITLWAESEVYATGPIRATSFNQISSRSRKKDIADLTLDEAVTALAELNPITYRYIDGDDDLNVGFIAEDVPELVAVPGRTGLNAMDIVALLTKVVQQQQRQITELEARLDQR